MNASAVLSVDRARAEHAPLHVIQLELGGLRALLAQQPDDVVVLVHRPLYEAARRFLTEDSRRDARRRVRAALRRRGPRACSRSSRIARATARWPRTCWPTPSSARCARAGGSTAAAAPRRPGCTRSRSTCCATTRAGRRPRGARSGGPAASRSRRRTPGSKGSSGARRSSGRSAGLSPEEREAIALRFGADLSVPEMATRAGRAADHRRGPRLPRAAQASRASGAARVSGGPC